MVGIHSRSTDAVNALCYRFINACGRDIRNFEIGAISKLVDLLIQFNLWDKFLAIYPFVGRTAFTHSLNLKNIDEFNITWYFSSAIIFNRAGVTGNGGYGLTNIPLRYLINNKDSHISAYNRTNFNSITGTGRFIGVNTLEILSDVSQMGALELNFNKNSGIVGYIYNKINTLGGHGYTIGEMLNDNISGRGFMIGVNSYDCYLNNNIFGYRFPALPTEIHPNCPRELTLLADRYDTRVTSSINANLAFASVGYGMTRKDVELFTFAVETFQQLMSRSIM
jgi:hypothetical protein